MFKPVFSISPECASALVRIGELRGEIASLPISAAVYAGLQHTMRLKSTHFSTRIEGNRMSLDEVTQLISPGPSKGKDRDQREVLGYYAALDQIDRWVESGGLLAERHIQVLHGISYRNAKTPTLYRDGPCAIGGGSGLTYLPPEAADVPSLMSELIAWINTSLDESQLPVPIIAGIAHYQFVTIHPYFDGNGRTGRLLTTLILHQNGFGMQGVYNLEEYYAESLNDYYAALSMGPSHNYYLGRADADITEWVTYFCMGMAEACESVRRQLHAAHRRDEEDQRQLLRQLSHAQRQVLPLLSDNIDVTSEQIAAALGVQRQRATQLCKSWVSTGFLELGNPSKRNRRYRLGHDLR